jgi:hypothetical protein
VKKHSADVVKRRAGEIVRDRRKKEENERERERERDRERERERSLINHA